MTAKSKYHRELLNLPLYLHFTLLEVFQDYKIDGLLQVLQLLHCSHRLSSPLVKLAVPSTVAFPSLFAYGNIKENFVLMQGLLLCYLVGDLEVGPPQIKH